jgi:hypothetical protein
MRSTICHVLCGAVVIAACSTAETRIDIVVTGTSHLAIDQLEYRIDDMIADGPVADEQTVTVSDHLNGVRTLIEVWGLEGGHRTAYGNATVTPVVGATVTAVVELGAGSGSGSGTTPCGTDAGACTPGIWTQIAVGLDYGCALRRDGSGTCWGNPAHTPALQGTYSALATYADTNYDYGGCAIDAASKQLACWGAANHLVPDDELLAVALNFGSNGVGSGGVAGCGVRTDHTLTCWGVGAQTPAPIGQYTAVGTGDNIACAIEQSGGIACWGTLEVGYVPPSNASFTQIALGDFACALTTAGAIECWGNNQLSAPPTGTFEAISLQQESALALRDDGWIVGWGASVPMTSGAFAAVAVGPYEYACGIRTNGELACWGNNDGYGQLDPPTR